MGIFTFPKEERLKMEPPGFSLPGAGRAGAGRVGAGRAGRGGITAAFERPRCILELCVHAKVAAIPPVVCDK